MILEDRFEIEPPIYIGQVATSYPARQKGLDRKVLLKVIHPQWMSDAELVERFNREARAIAQIDHPNVVKVFDFGEADGVLFMALEWIDGGTLKDKLRSGPLSQALVKQIAQGILAGLDAVHKSNLIHRDIKPDNILIGADGSPRLADFSLAGFSRISALTRHGDMIGSPAYLAPELLDGTPASTRSDLYALGLVLLETLTGSNPHQADDPVLCLELVRKVDPPRLSNRSSIDKGLAHLIDSLLQRKPESRPRDTASALRLLQDEQVSVAVKTSFGTHYQFGIIAVVYSIAIALVLVSGGTRIEQQFESAKLIKPAAVIKDLDASVEVELASPEKKVDEISELINSTPIQERTISNGIPDPIAVKTGKIKIIARPWAEIYIDNEPVGLTPMEAIELQAGIHRLKLLHYDLPPYEKEITIEPDQLDTIAVDLKAEAGQLSITATPWGYLWIDGDSIGILPRDEPVWVTPGLHSILIDHPDLNSWSDTLRIGRSEEVSIRFDMKNGTMVALDKTGKEDENQKEQVRKAEQSIHKQTSE